MDAGIEAQHLYSRPYVGLVSPQQKLNFSRNAKVRVDDLSIGESRLDSDEDRLGPMPVREDLCETSKDWVMRFEAGCSTYLS